MFSISLIISNINNRFKVKSNDAMFMPDGTATQNIVNHFSIEKLPAIVFTVSAIPKSL